MKKRYLTLPLLLCGSLALGILAACGDGDPKPKTDGTTEVTYVFVMDDVRLTYEKTQDTGSALSYTTDIIDHKDTWFSDESLTTPVETAEGKSMTVYTSFEDIAVYCVFRTPTSFAGGSQSKTVQANKREGVTLIDGFTVAGHQFLGWMNDGNTYQAGEKFSLAGVDKSKPVVEFEASLKKQSYTVTYKSEGASDETVTQEYGSAVKAAPTRTGYNFVCWQDEKGNAVEVIEGEVTLTAKWEIKKYSVTVYSYTDDTEGQVTKTYDWNASVSLATGARLGYDFSHWTVSVDGGAARTLDGSSYLVGSDYDATSIVIRPVYQGHPYTLALEGAKVDSVDLHVGDKLYESLKSAEVDDFSGWFYDAELTKPVGPNDILKYVAAGESFKLYGSAGKKYTVTFVVDGQEREKEYAFNTAFTSEDKVEKEGHTFVGWFTAAEGGEEVTGVFASSITVYARFTINSYTVTYDGGENAINPPAAVTQKYGTQITVAAAGNMTRPHATFSHWEDEEGNEYYPGTTFTLNKDITLHAVWDGKHVTVTLVDWDGYVIATKEYFAGDTFTYDKTALKLWLGIDEFAGFTYKDELFGRVYTLEEGQIITDSFEQIVATVKYVNRYTGEALYTEGAAEIMKNFVYLLREDSGNANTYIVSGKTGVVGTTGNKLSKTFKGGITALPKSFALPVTYQGKLVTGIPASDVATTGAFAIANANNSNAGDTAYDPAPYSVDTLYIPSQYNYVGAFAFSGQTHATVYIGRNSRITEFTESNGLTASASRVIGLPYNLQIIRRNGFTGRSTTGDAQSFVVYDQNMKQIKELPASIRYIYQYALTGNDIFEKVDLSNVTYLGSQVFAYHDNIKEVIIGSKLTNIPSGLFRGCAGITSIYIPAQITMIYGAAFAGCENLTQITFEQNSKLKEIGEWAFLFHSAKEIELPEGLEIIGSAAFAHNYSFEDDNNAGTGWYAGYSPLESITLPSTLKAIDSFAFASTSIKTITFPAKLEQIGEGAFYDTPYLKYIELNEGLKLIEQGAFRKQKDFTWSKGEEFVLNIPSTVELIRGKYHAGAFESFKNITGITFAVDSEGKSALRVLMAYAFADLPELQGSLVFPEGLAKIDAYIFPMQAPVTGFYDDDLVGPKVTSITIPSTVYSIGYEAFKNFELLTELIFTDNEGTVAVLDDKELSKGNVVVAGVTDAYLAITGAAFRGCATLKTVELPCQLISMNGNASLEGELQGVFFGAESLTDITFRGRTDGNDLPLSISACTFEGCTSVKNIKILRHTRIVVAPLDGNSLAYDPSLIFLRHARKKNVNVYCYSDDWSYYSNAAGWSGSKIVDLSTLS